MTHAPRLVESRLNSFLENVEVIAPPLAGVSGECRIKIIITKEHQKNGLVGVAIHFLFALDYS